MVVKTAVPCLAAVEAYPRMAYRSRVVFSERSRPEIFCWVFRRAEVALGLVGGRRDPRIAEEPQHVGLAVLEAFQQHAAGFLLRLRAGHRADL